MRSSRRPRVLLVTSDAAEPWRQALWAAGIEVRSTGWLDAVTAARLHKPDLLLLGGDLEASARQLILNTVRGSELHALRVLVAGLPSEEIEAQRAYQCAADHLVASPVDPGALAAEVWRALRPEQAGDGHAAPAIVGLLLFAVAAGALFGTRLCMGGALGTACTAWIAGDEQSGLLLGLSAYLGALLALALAGQRRLVWMRAALGWGLFLGVQVAPVAERLHGAQGLLAVLGATLLILAGWAWLGLRVKPRSPVARGWLRALAAGTAALGLLSLGYVAIYG